MAIERLDDVRARLREDALQRGVNPRDVDLLLSDLLSRSMAWLYAHGEVEFDAARIEAYLQRRYAGEPLQYIRGRSEFYSREFIVDERVLIPRPETELLVETTLERAPRNARVIDIGAGSGCIAISLALERDDLRVVSVDRSVEALAVAALNRDRLSAPVRFFASDLLSATHGTFEVIVSNPPYVPLREYEQLAVEVRIHEPRMALTPGRRGTEIIDRILTESRARLAPKGIVILEVGYGQEEAVRKLAAKRKYNVDAFLPDLAGIPRIVVLSGAW
jgi:release factor glutamine methyltransferase